jgi:PAS domain-containing protein
MSHEKTEGALAESGEDFRSTFEDLLVGVVVHAADTSILFSNPQASLLLELSREQMQGRQAIDPAWHFIHEDGSVVDIEDYPVNRAIATGRTCLKMQSRRLERLRILLSRPWSRPAP